jgi:peroxiredoxin
MTLTPSTMQSLGTKAPDFNLPSTSGDTVSLSNFDDKEVLVVAFICNHCPYVKHIKSGLLTLYNDYKDKGVGFVAINSNDVSSYPEDSFENMKNEGYPFPYLFDETQKTAKAYKAACTPDFFVYDNNRVLKYRGQMDGSRPGNFKPNDGKDLRSAIDMILSGFEVGKDQKPSTGCNIKWKRGNEPSYF